MRYDSQLYDPFSDKIKSRQDYKSRIKSCKDFKSRCHKPLPSHALPRQCLSVPVSQDHKSSHVISQVKSSLVKIASLPRPATSQVLSGLLAKLPRHRPLPRLQVKLPRHKPLPRLKAYHAATSLSLPASVTDNTGIKAVIVIINIVAHHQHC